MAQSIGYIQKMNANENGAGKLWLEDTPAPDHTNAFHFEAEETFIFTLAGQAAAHRREVVVNYSLDTNNLKRVVSVVIEKW